MKRILILLLFYCSFILSAKATVFVSGIISSNTTWTKTNSPYIVNGNLSVDSAVTLTIQPGVEIRVDSSYGITINGILIAQGTSTDTIKFTSNKSAPSKKAWRGITFSSKGKRDTSRIDYCRFEYGDTALMNSGTYVYVYHSVFRRNNIGILTDSFAYSTVINKCLISWNNKGVHYNGKYASLSETTLSYNNIGLFEGNIGVNKGMQTTYDSFNYNIIGYWCLGNGTYGFDVNWFKGNSKYGIYVSSPTGVGGGIKRICNSIFIYNATAICLDSALADYLYKNTFGYNDIGLQVNYPLNNTAPISVGGTYFGHCFTHNASYNVVNNSAKGISMDGCKWGPVTPTGIDSTIYDHNDDTTLGTVNYSGYSTCCPCVIPPPPPCYPHPDSIVATLTSTNSISAHWPAVTGAYTYEYYVAPLSATTPISGTFTFDTSFTTTNLLPGEVYQVCVRTRCQSSPFYSAWVCDTVTTSCDTPALLTIDSVNRTSVIASWDTVAGVFGYDYSVQPHPSTPTWGTYTANHSVFITGLTPGTTYDFCVRTRCLSSSSGWICDTFRTSPTGINILNTDNDVRIYPNPSKGTFTISLSNNNSHATVTVFDITGRIVTSRQMENASETISLNNAAKGVYTIRIRTDGAVINRRLVIE